MATYTLQHAVAIAQRLEALIFEKFNLHIAIGGSLVYRGTSKKDIDIFLYPHSKDTEIDRDKIAAWLEDQGFKYRLQNTEVDALDEDWTQIPDVWVTEEVATKNKVDFFFLERHTVLTPSGAKEQVGLDCLKSQQNWEEDL